MTHDQNASLDDLQRMKLDRLIACGCHIGGQAPNEFDAWDLTCAKCLDRLVLIRKILKTCSRISLKTEKRND
jgi:hypothetical protein